MSVIKNSILLTIVFCLSLSGIIAQESDGVRTMRAGQLNSFGKNAFRQGDYSSAAMYFEGLTEKKPKNYKAAFKLAESFRLSKSYRNAQDAYLKAYELKPTKNALALFHYATMLKMNGQYELSDVYYAKFKKVYKGKDKSSYLKMIGNNTKAAEFVSNSIKNPVKIGIQHLDESINTGHVEAAPLYINDSTIIYSSLKTDQTHFYINPEDSTTSEPFRKFYIATKQNDKWQGGSEYSGPFNKNDAHISNGAISNDGQRFYFTECKRNRKNKIICAIYVSTLEDNEWGEPVSLGSNVNISNFSNTQPTVGIESAKSRETIYFVSDREGGRGGLDIWYTFYDTKKKVYTNPINAGPKLNTAGDEVTPHFDWSTRNLFFSSDGWQGLGGLDIFKTNGELKKWSTPENLGSPLNSSYDDLYYVLNKFNSENGLFVSNREIKGSLGTAKGCCDDLFSFQWLDAVKIELSGTLAEENHPVKGAKISLEVKNPDDSTFVPVNSGFSGADGKFSMTLMPNREYRVVTKKEGYLGNVHEFNTNDVTKSGTISFELGMTEAPLEAIPLQNIYYDYAKATLTEAARTAIDTTLLLILANNPDLVIELSSHTDHIGKDEANQQLSQDRAESVVQYLISKGINEKLLRAQGYGESKPIAPNQNTDGSDNPEGRQLNRRTEFRIIGKLLPDGKVIEPGNF